MGGMSPSYKNVKMLALFWYLIGNYHTRKGLIVGVGDLLVTGKGGVSGGIFWARGKILVGVKGWFSVFSSSIR